MFSGDEVEVDLQCDNSLMKTMIDRFGENVKTLAYDMTSFRLITEVLGREKWWKDTLCTRQFGYNKN